MKKTVMSFSKSFFRTRTTRLHKNRVYNKHCGFISTKFKFKGHKNVINAIDSIFYKCQFLITGSNNSISIGSHCKLKYVVFCIEGDNNNIIIGDNCAFCGRTEISCLEGTTILIGNNLLSSSDVFIRTSDSHTIYNLEGKRINHAKDVTIGNNVWICQKASILKGVSIPNNSVIAYGSIVTKKFHDDNCIIGGCPAKVIKNNIKWGEERK